MQNNNLNYHDAMVHNIDINVQEQLLEINLTPYEKGSNYDGSRKALTFKGLISVDISGGDTSQLNYIHDLSVKEKNGDAQYIISFSGPGVLKIVCKDMMVK